MDDNGIRQTLESLLVADPDVMDRHELATLTAQLGRLRSWCAATEVRVARRTKQLAADGRCESAASLLSDDGRVSSKDAHSACDRETICATMPSFEDALATGAVSAGHLDALAAATRNLNDHVLAEFVALQGDLLSDASHQKVETFERNCRDLARHLTAQQQPRADADELDQQRNNSTVKRWTDKITGMRNTLLSLDPLRDAELWSAVNAKLAALRQTDGNTRTPWAQLQVNALIATVACGDSVARVPEVSVLIDHKTITSGLHQNSICELDNGTPIPVSTARRLCCDAGILPIVLATNGEVLDVGQTARTATPAQRRALRVMHRSCAHPDCSVTYDNCRIHHIEFFRNGGNTDNDNMLPLCEQHHHLVHEGGWKLTMTKGRIATWQRPDGAAWHSGPTIDRRSASRTKPADRLQPALC
jgi:hypothetical protein